MAGPLLFLKYFPYSHGIHDMLTTIGIILVVLWLVAVIAGFTLGGLIHILLVVAIIVFLVRVIKAKTRSSSFLA